MRKFNLKYGFLSTYRSTIFIRRAADYKFEISPPVDYRATRPSLRECFMAFAALADNDRIYTETPGFNARLVRATLGPGSAQLCKILTQQHNEALHVRHWRPSEFDAWIVLQKPHNPTAHPNHYFRFQQQNNNDWSKWGGESFCYLGQYLTQLDAEKNYHGGGLCRLQSCGQMLACRVPREVGVSYYKNSVIEALTALFVVKLWVWKGFLWCNDWQIPRRYRLFPFTARLWRSRLFVPRVRRKCHDFLLGGWEAFEWSLADLESTWSYLHTKQMPGSGCDYSPAKHLPAGFQQRKCAVWQAYRKGHNVRFRTLWNLPWTTSAEPWCAWASHNLWTKWNVTNQWWLTCLFYIFFCLLFTPSALGRPLNRHVRKRFLACLCPLSFQFVFEDPKRSTQHSKFFSSWRRLEEWTEGDEKLEILSPVETNYKPDGWQLVNGDLLMPEVDPDFPYCLFCCFFLAYAFPIVAMFLRVLFCRHEQGRPTWRSITNDGKSWDHR